MLVELEMEEWKKRVELWSERRNGRQLVRVLPPKMKRRWGPRRRTAGSKRVVNFGYKLIVCKGFVICCLTQLEFKPIVLLLCAINSAPVPTGPARIC